MYDRCGDDESVEKEANMDVWNEDALLPCVCLRILEVDGPSWMVLHDFVLPPFAS